MYAMVMKYNKLENVQPVKRDSTLPIINNNKTAISSCPLIAHKPKLYTPSTLNIDFIQWHTQLIMCAVE